MIKRSKDWWLSKAQSEGDSAVSIGSMEEIMIIPRRNRMDQWTSAERTIQDAVDEVERMGADTRLTEAVVLLGKARDSVANFVDGISAHQPAAAEPDMRVPPAHTPVALHGVTELIIEEDAAVGSCVERRVFEGRARICDGTMDLDCGIEDGPSGDRRHVWTDANCWLNGLEDKRVRLVVEVLPDEPAAACRYQTWLDSDEDQASGPTCGKPATHRACSPKDEPRCAEHKCRCDLPLPEPEEE